MIFSRWGKLIFCTKTIHFGCNGTQKEKLFRQGILYGSGCISIAANNCEIKYYCTLCFASISITGLVSCNVSALTILFIMVLRMILLTGYPHPMPKAQRAYACLSAIENDV